MISYTSIFKLFILIVLLSLLLMSFSWNPKLYFIIFFISIVSFLLIKLQKYKIDLTSFSIIVFVFIINIFSAISGKMLSIDIDYSFFIQIFLFPFILLGVNILYKMYTPFFNSSMEKFFYLTIFLLLLQLSISFYFYGFNHLSSIESILFTDVYNFAYIANEKIGTHFKGILSWLSFLFLLFTYDILKKPSIIFFFSLVIISTVILGAKANLIGIFITLYFIWLLQIKSKNYRLLILYTTFFTGVFIVYTYFDIFNTIMILDGRYYAPILTSEDFWSNPFGIGMGNYTNAALNNIYKIDTGGLFPSVWIHTDMVDKFGWFPVAEADPILLMVSFGWIPYSIYLFIIFYTIYYHVVKADKLSLVNRQGFFIFVMLFFSGLFQDWFNVHAYWVFLGLSIAMMTYKERRSVL